MSAVVEEPLSSERHNEVVRQQWTSVAAAWDRWFDWYSSAFAPLMEWCCDVTTLSPGDRVLDVACGTGEPALRAAKRVGPHGSVVAIDLSTDMLNSAARRAAAAGISNVEFRGMDAENLRFPARSFDAATFACGLMFCADPARAVAEVRRVLRPGGRYAIVVWDEPSKNPYFSVFGRAAAQVLPIPRPSPDRPGPFRFAQRTDLAAVITAGGSSGFDVQSVSMMVECESVEHYMRAAAELAAPLQALLATLDAAGRRRLEQLVHEGAAPYLDGRRLRLTATALGVTGRVT